jgi:hypothetical protein
VTLKEELKVVQPAIREALELIGFQMNIPYTLGSCQGGVIKLYEFCTFTVPDHEPLVLGVTLKNVEGKLELVLDLVEEDSGYMHWRVNLGELPEGGVPKLAEMALANLPKSSVIKKILIPEPKPEEPKNQKQLLTEVVKSIRMSGVSLDRAVEMVEAFLEHTLKIALTSQARNIMKYLEKYIG